MPVYLNGMEISGNTIQYKTMSIAAGLDKYSKSP